MLNDNKDVAIDEISSFQPRKICLQLVVGSFWSVILEIQVNGRGAAAKGLE
jgi:hypothetical protein